MEKENKYVLLAGTALYVFMGSMTYLASDLDAFLLFNTLLIFFLPLIWIVYRLKIISLLGFFGLVFMAHVIAPPFFFINRSTYTYKGWSAIWDFDFTIFRYLNHYWGLYLFFILIIVITAGLTNFFLKIKPWYRLNSTEGTLRENKNNQSFFRDVFIVVFLLTNTGLTYWMFNHGIGMTGIKPPNLPFKLSGGLNYYARFVVPLVMYFLLKKSQRGILILSIATLYAFWSGIASLSKTGIALNMIPVIFFSLKDKRFLLSTFSVFFFLIGINLVITARAVLYVIDDGDVSLNDNITGTFFSDLLSSGTRNVDFEELLNTVLQRIGGNQDVVVATHYNKYHSGNGMKLFRRYILLQKGSGDNRQFIKDLTGINIPKGFAYGLGFSARTIAISELKLWRFVLLAFIASLQITFNEILLSRAIRRIKQPEFILFLALIFNLLFFALVQSQRVYGFLILLGLFLFALKIKELKFIFNKILID